MSDVRIDAALKELTRQNADLRNQLVERSADVADLQHRLVQAEQEKADLQGRVDALEARPDAAGEVVDISTEADDPD